VITRLPQQTTTSNTNKQTNKPLQPNKQQQTYSADNTRRIAKTIEAAVEFRLDRLLRIVFVEQ
jgi:hypothetical protein